MDDEKDFLNTQAERLASRGSKVSTATSGEDAAANADKEADDLIVLDQLVKTIVGAFENRTLALKKGTRLISSTLFQTFGSIPNRQVFMAGR